MNYLTLYTNTQIIHFLQQQPHRLKQFLLEVPINDLNDAVQQKQRITDLQFKRRRTQDNAFKKNVTDFTLDQVIHACYTQGIINYFQKNSSRYSTRLQNHPQYGMRLVNKIPEKYYAAKSHHYNHSEQINQVYGFFNDESQEFESQQNRNINQQGNQGHDNQGGANNDEANQGQQGTGNNGSQIPQDQNDFIVQDDQVQASQQDEIDRLQRQVRARKANKRNKDKIKQVIKMQKQQISERTTGKKLRKQSQESQQCKIVMEDYILADDLQSNLSKKEKKENKKLIKEKQINKRITRNSIKNELKIQLQGDDKISGRPSMKMKLELD